jgi:hypothetical protein
VVKSVAKYVAKCVVESLLLNQLLDTSEDEDVFLAEESWQDLLELPVTRQILQEDLDVDACIEIKDMGFALHLFQPAELWLLLTDHYSSSKILSKHAERWRTKIIKTVQASEADFFSSLTEYLSTSLAAELFCERCLEKGSPHYVEERIDRLVTLLQPILSEDKSMLEICCGSGMATQALIRNGCRPISMDYDRCDLCMGLKSGLMDPKRCFLLDARLLPQIFPEGSFHTVLGFMVGLIDDFNWPLWREILLAASRLAKNRVLFTVYTQKEAELIAKALGDIGWRGMVIDNRDSKGIYDQWAYLAVKQD